VTVLVVVEGVVITLLAVLVAGLLRSHADILRTLHERGLGDHPTGAGSASAAVDAPLAVSDGVVAPGPGSSKLADITGVEPDGATRRVAVAGTEHPTLLAFLSTGCVTCAGFWKAFADPGHVSDLPTPTTRLVIVTKGEESESPAKVRQLAPEGITTVMSSGAWASYKVPGSPYFVLVDGASGIIAGEGSGTGWSQVGSLLKSSIADRGLALQGAARAVRHDDGPAREARADAELAAAGIRPGDASLYPTDLPQVDGAAVPQSDGTAVPQRDALEEGSR
jgi:hypothetical protein